MPVIKFCALRQLALEGLGGGGAGLAHQRPLSNRARQT